MTSPNNPLSFPVDGKLHLHENNEQSRDENMIILCNQTQHAFQRATEDNKGLSELLGSNLDHKAGDDEINSQSQRLGKNSRHDSIRSYQSFKAPVSQTLEESLCKEDHSISLSTLTGISNSKKKDDLTMIQKSDNNVKRSHSTEVQEICVPGIIFLGDATPKLKKLDEGLQIEILGGRPNENRSRKAVTIYVCFVVLFVLGAVTSLIIILMKRNSSGRSKLSAEQEGQSIQDGGYNSITWAPSSSSMSFIQPVTSSPTKTSHYTSSKPSMKPTSAFQFPSYSPSLVVSMYPTFTPSTKQPSNAFWTNTPSEKTTMLIPTHTPIQETKPPTDIPTFIPTEKTESPTFIPTYTPTTETKSPTFIPTYNPTAKKKPPTSVPTYAFIKSPSLQPSRRRSDFPSPSPSLVTANTEAPSKQTELPTASLSITPSPSIAATTHPPTWLPTEMPFIPPTEGLSSFDKVFAFVAQLSTHDQGESLRDKSSPQYKALDWLSQNIFLDQFSEQQTIQRFAMATFFYSTSGEPWEESYGWLSETSECAWFSTSSSPCDNGGILRDLDIQGNAMYGTLPIELSWLTTLTRIDLQSNQISGSLPSEFGRLNNLQFLQLSDNALSGTVPWEVETMSSLGKYFVSNDIDT
jgi:hypothetical protein